LAYFHGNAQNIIGIKEMRRFGAVKREKIESVKFDQSEREERRTKEYESAWLSIVVIAIGEGRSRANARKNEI